MITLGLNIDSEILPIHPLIFTGGVKKVQNLAFQAPIFEMKQHNITYLKQTWRGPSMDQFGSV